VTESGRKLLISSLLLLIAGTLIGWAYGYPERGLLIATVLALLWQIRNLIAFERALQTGDFSAFRYGEGIWQQLFSRFRYERSRGDRYKARQRQLLKEIRRSTNAMPDGAVILNQANEIVMCNRAANTLAGLKPRKDRGQRLDNILRDPGISDLLGKNEATLAIDIESPVTDNAWLSCRVVPYGADQKLLLIRDVTERIRLYRMRRDFVANASHELRSPLTVIGGYLDSFADDKSIPSDLVQPIAQMQAQAQRMAAVIRDLLELSRLESSGYASFDETVDIAAMLASTRNAYTGVADTPTLEVVVESPSRLLGKSSEIESVIRNLVSNAIRHTPIDGKVTLLWRTRPAGGELVIRDTGEGISGEHLPRLTERFFRVDRGRARGDGGVGLGPAIVKHVLERHNAALQVSSEPGRGSEFSCVFPATRIAAALSQN
jgi:two-component system phosphate regulon sensor histidine kinase PhoR